jgi:hypothetical protein
MCDGDGGDSGDTNGGMMVVKTVMVMEVKWRL